jgi:hypothetical protein
MEQCLFLIGNNGKDKGPANKEITISRHKKPILIKDKPVIAARSMSNETVCVKDDMKISMYD